MRRTVPFPPRRRVYNGTMQPENSQQGSQHLYEVVAGRISCLIEGGTFRTGDRLPSVRSLSRQLQVSINTVMEAYTLLEDRRLIEARPQSGFYVRGRLPAIPSAPVAAAPVPSPACVSIS